MNLLRQIFALTVKEIRVLWHDREALALLFLMPVFFILVMSLALQGVFESGSRERPIEILAINEDKGGEAKKIIFTLEKIAGIKIIDSLNGRPLTYSVAADHINSGQFCAALHFRRQFSERIQSGISGIDDVSPVLSMIVDPTINVQLMSSVRGTIQGVVERHLFLHRLPQLLEQGVDRIGETGDAAMIFALDSLKSRLKGAFSNLSSENMDRELLSIPLIPLSAAEAGRRPTSTEQNVPAYTIFGVFFIVLTLASSFIKEKNDGTFQRVLTAPLPKAALIMGKLLPYYIVNLIQIALMFAVGVLVFDLPLGNLPALVFVSLALAASANGLGLLVATIGKTEAQVNGLSVMLAITLSALGGMMVPAFVMPGFMKKLAQFTPHAWALAGYHDVIIRGLGLSDVMPEISVLAGFSGLFFLIALWRLRFD
jgi:ABC-2 type transport system permease protein